MDLVKRLTPSSLEGQMVAVLAVSFAALLLALAVLEVLQHRSAVETAQSSLTLERLERLYPVLERVGEQDAPAFVDIASSCHAGHTVSDLPFRVERTTDETARLRARLASALDLDPGRIRVGLAVLTRADFAYAKCRASDIDLPAEGVVISILLGSGQWLNAEVHPHEWHVREKLDWMLSASVLFCAVGAIAIFFMHRLSRPLNELTAAARRFGAGLEPSVLREDGPLDLRRAIQAFNSMQQQVAGEIARRTGTLAAISHDVRTPLTALRVKAEMIDEPAVREDVIRSIERMERITASALDFLRGESLSEAVRLVDVSALVGSECSDFADLGHDVEFVGEEGIEYACRPDALARAVRNLIENAVKYAGSARAAVQAAHDSIEIRVIDDGAGIAAEQRALALEPFVRLSAARSSDDSGFGLGLAVAKAIAEGHGGELLLTSNAPQGLIATIRLPQR